MTREELFFAVFSVHPEDGELIYIERRGEDYRWRRAGSEAGAPPVDSAGGASPDVWIYYSGRWSIEEADRRRAFFDDLLAEMESMAGSSDRCRWPLDKLWPHRH